MMEDTWAQFVGELGIQAFSPFDPRALVPERRIRDLCAENKCGNYNDNHMCLPRVGPLEEVTGKLRRYKRGILLQYSVPVNVENDRQALRETKLDFHDKVLRFEELLRTQGVEHVWGMVGGSCDLCEVCQARVDEPCPYPERARTSLAALGIDVVALLDKCGLDSAFRRDRVTWTGCVLYWE